MYTLSLNIMKETLY